MAKIIYEARSAECARYVMSWDKILRKIHICARLHMGMATKTISIMNDAYNLLVRHKMKNESFSDAIRRILTKQGNVLEFAEAWKDVSDKDAEDMKKSVSQLRKKSTKKILRIRL